MKTTQEIKEILLKFHEQRGYKIFNSFPILSSDPTVMFVNATITPFKHYFSDNNIVPKNYAFNQRCFRMGGASDLDLMGSNPYYHTFFEMFGSGMFSTDYSQATRYLLDLLEAIGLEMDRIYIAIPPGKSFMEGLAGNGFDESKIFALAPHNDIFWKEWKFGKLGPVGRGLTVIYSRIPDKIHSLKEVDKGSDRFVELCNLIHIYGQEEKNGSITPIANPGFEFAVGIERLMAVLQNCNNYQTDAMLPLSECVLEYGKANGGLTEISARILTDHLRAICILTDEGLKPSSKKEGYVFRKLIRRTLETAWLTAGKIIPVDDLAREFCAKFNQCDRQNISPEDAAEIVMRETESYIKAIKTAKKALTRDPLISAAVLKDTYGLPQEIIPFLEEINEHF